MAKNFTEAAERQGMDIDNYDLMKLKLASRGTIKLVVESCVFLIFSIIGLVGNVCVCVAVYRNSSLRQKATNFAFVALALSDVLVCTLVSPFILAVLIKGRWIFGEDVCKFQAMTTYSLVGVSLYLMALIAINRYFCVAKPATYSAIFTTKSTIIYSCVVWIGVIGVVVILHQLHMFSFYFHPFKAICVLYMAQKYSTIVSHLVNYLSTFLLIGIPFIVFIVSYTKIFLLVRRHQLEVANTLQNPEVPANASGMSSRAAELRMTRTMLIVVLVYMLCWFPPACIDIVMNTAFSWNEINRTLALCCTLLGLLSSVTNPWIISIMNRTYRTEVALMLCCKMTK